MLRGRVCSDRILYDSRIRVSWGARVVETEDQVVLSFRNSNESIDPTLLSVARLLSCVRRSDLVLESRFLFSK
jgi:hypothetical protein